MHGKGWGKRMHGKGALVVVLVIRVMTVVCVSVIVG
jgi:hypothetical protein